MNQKMRYVGLLAILSLATFSLSSSSLTEAEAVQYEDPVPRQGSLPDFGSEDEPRVPPIIRIIGIEK